MDTQTDHGKRKGRGETAKIEATGGGGGGGIIVIGCALIGAAIGAAFVAHRGRVSSHRGRGRKVDQEEEKGLQTLLPSADSSDNLREREASSVNNQESASDNKSENRDSTESDEGSEGTGDSSTESGAEVVWPSEVIEQQKQFSPLEVDELKQISEVSENYREEEFSFDSSVEIQETICKDPEIVNHVEADTTDTIDDNNVVEEFSFWSVKSSMPEIYIEQNLAESEIAHVPEEGKLEPKEEIEEFQIMGGGEKREKGSEIMEASAKTIEMKQQEEITEKTEKISVSESENSRRQLQNLLTATYSVEQQKGHILVDSSVGTQDNACSDLDKEMETSESHNTCENFEVVVETREKQSETYMNADNNLFEESDISHIEEEQGSSLINSQEEIELQVENVGEKEEEKTEKSQSSVEFSDHAVLPADIIEQGKMDGSLSITEMKDREILFSSAEINIRDLDKEMETSESHNTCGNFVVVVEKREKQSETYMNADNLVEESDISHIEEEQGSSSINSQEEIELQVKNVGENEEEKSEELRSSVEFSDHAVLPADIIEQGKMDGSLSITEIKDREILFSSAEINIRDLDKEMETSESHNTCENFEVVVEKREKQSETYMNADNNLVEESDISHIEEEQSSSSINSQEETELQVENVGEKEEDKSEELRSSVEFSDHAVLPADIIEEGKMDGSLSITEKKDREFLFNSAEISMPDNETDEHLEDSAIAHKEVVEEEQEEEKGNDEQEDTPVNSLEEEIRSPVEEGSERGQMETKNSPKEFAGKEIWPYEAASKELSEDAAWPAKPIKQEEPPSAVTNEMKQEEYFSEKTEDIIGSEADDNTRTLQNLIHSTNSAEQEKGCVLDTSEENQVSSCNDFKNTEMAVEAKVKQSEADTSDDNGLVQEPDISHEEEEEEGSSVNFQEEIEMPVKDAGEKGEEESEGSRNSSVEFDDQAVLPADASGQEKMDGSMSITERKHQLKIPRENEETDCSAEGDTKYNGNLVQESLFNGVEFNILGDEIDHVEPEVVVEEEQEEKGDDKQEGSSEKSLEEKIMSDVEEESEREESIVADNSKEIDFKVNKTGIDWEGSEIVHVEAEEDQEDKAGCDERQNSPVKSLEEEICSAFEEEDKTEEPKGNGNSSIEFYSKGNETGVDSEDSKIVHVEAEVVVEQEQEERGDDKQESSSVKSLEEEIMLNVEVENESEESIVTDDSSKEFDFKVNRTGIDWAGSEIVHIEAKVVDEAQEEKGGYDKREGSSVKPLEEEICSAFDEEIEREEPKGNDNSFMEIDSKCSMTDVYSEDSEIVHVEAEIVEGHEECRGNHKQEGSSVKSLEDEIILNVEEKNEREESKEKGNSFVEFESKGKKTGVDSEDSEIAHVEGEIVEEKEGDNKRESSTVKSLGGEIMSVAEEESEREESIRTGNSSIEFDTKGVWPAELVELENGPVPMCEMKQLPENLEEINPIIGVVQAEGDENTTGGIQTFIISNDKQREISGESAEEIQEKVCMDLHAETEGSQNTCKNSEMSMEIEESQMVPNIDHGDDIVKECSYDDSISNILQEQNNQDLEESNTSHEEKEAENTSTALQEAEIESSIEEDSERENEEPEEKKDSSTQTEVIEKEEGFPLVENEMKLQSENAKKTTGVVNIGQAKEDGDEVHEQEVLKREPDIMLTDKEKRMDFILAGSSKVFLLVLALTLALGLLAFAHNDHLHNYKHRLPEIYRQLSQLIFPSHNGGIGEL